MPDLFAEIAVPDSLRDRYEGEDDNRIHRLSKLNVFIGPNNSGKSFLLRTLFSEPSLKVVPADDGVREMADDIETAKRILRSGTGLDPITEHAKTTLTGFLNYGLPLKVTTSTSNPGNLAIEQARWAKELRALLSGELGQKADLTNETTLLHRKMTQIRERYYNRATGEIIHADEFKRVYIPSMRGLRPLNPPPDHSPSWKAPAHIYRARTIADYFKSVDRLRTGSVATAENRVRLRDCPIVTGTEFYDEVRDHLLGTREQRKLAADYERYLATKFFQGMPVELIPRVDSDVLYIKVGNDHERPIYELGDGLQQIIILTLPIFMHRGQKLMLFVEEPELFLHPGFQRAFIDLVLDESDGETRQVFVATHSNQFMDITLDRRAVSVYKLFRLPDAKTEGDVDPKFSVNLVSDSDDSLLADLGIRNSSVLLANCTIWIEGITDRLYLRHFIALLYESNLLPRDGRQFLEEIHFAFVEYGGGNVVHWSFSNDPESAEGRMTAKRVCPQILLIADRDSGKELRHELLAAELGDCFRLLEVSEIENLLPPLAIRAVLDRYGEDMDALPEFKHEDYARRKLGTFIQGVLLKGKAKRKGGYAEKSGTVKAKSEFARTAISAIKTYDELPPEAKQLTRKIYDFIASKNP